MTTEQERFVTYKWLLAQTIALIATIISVGFLIHGSMTTALDGKVSREIFDERTGSLCGDIKEIKDSIKSIEEKIISIERNVK